METKKTNSKKRKTNRPLVLISIILATFMSAVEGTIVSTALPEIVGELGGFSLYSWVFSAYLLMNTVTVLIYGKLADLFGRKPVLLFGISVFMIGSLFAGFAWSMQSLIFFRLIQGFGAGAVTPIAMTVVGDIYSREERAKIQGYLSSVWGISAILGPALGGFFVQYSSWSWIFWINIPLGLLAVCGLVFFFHEEVKRKKHKIDYLGAALITGSITLSMYVFVEGGIRFDWLSSQSFLYIGIIALLFYLFVRHENRFEEPVMPFAVWRIRPILIANLTSLLTGMILIGISSYLPAFVQGVMGLSPTIAGFTLTVMSIGWPIASTASGYLLLKIGYRSTCILGGVFLVFGGTIFMLLPSLPNPFLAAFGSFLTGAGMGLTSTAFIVSIQSTVEWESRGAATAANMFMRNLGNTVGAAVLGGILNNRLQAYFLSHDYSGEKLDLNSVNELLSAEVRSTLAPEKLSQLQSGLTHALGYVYTGVFILALCALILILFMPRKEVEESRG